MFEQRGSTGVDGRVAPAMRLPAAGNPFIERLIGSIRRECLDHVVVINERHLRRIEGFSARPGASVLRADNVAQGVFAEPDGGQPIDPSP
jgi:CTP:molybdopterin cytidylyltransferase MocA